MRKTLLGYDHIGIVRLRKMGVLDGWTEDEIKNYMQDRLPRRKAKAKNAGQKKFNVYTEDPNCKSCGKNKKKPINAFSKRKNKEYESFKSHMNKHLGKTAIVIGKGPTLSKWLRYKPKKKEDTVLIAINNASSLVESDYAITGDGALLEPVGNPIIVANGRYAYEKHVHYNHTEDRSRSLRVANLSKESMADGCLLYAASSSAQVAIHWSWFIGCEKIELVGCDGFGGYAKELSTMPAGGDYELMRKDTVMLLNHLFPKSWKDRYVFNKKY